MLSKKSAHLLGVFIIVTLLALAAGCSQPTPTPSTTGNLQVTVLDTDNNPLNGAKVVSLAQPEGQTGLNGITTASSNVITFSGVKIGNYQISVSQANYQGVIINTNVVPGQSTMITAKLVKLPAQ